MHDAQAEYTAHEKATPPFLFAHNPQQRAAQNVHAQSVHSKGVLGRMVQALREHATPFSTGLYSMDGTVKMLEGADQAPDYLHPTQGVPLFKHSELVGADMERLLERESASIFGETHQNLLLAALQRTELLGQVLDNVSLSQTYVKSSMSQVEAKLWQVSRVIAARQALGVERDVFVRHSQPPDGPRLSRHA